MTFTWHVKYKKRTKGSLFPYHGIFYTSSSPIQMQHSLSIDVLKYLQHIRNMVLLANDFTRASLVIFGATTHVARTLKMSAKFNRKATKEHNAKSFPVRPDSYQLIFCSFYKFQIANRNMHDSATWVIVNRSRCKLQTVIYIENELH